MIKNLHESVTPEITLNAKKLDHHSMIVVCCHQTFLQNWYRYKLSTLTERNGLFVVFHLYEEYQFKLLLQIINLLYIATFYMNCNIVYKC